MKKKRAGYRRKRNRRERKRKEGEQSLTNSGRTGPLFREGGGMGPNISLEWARDLAVEDTI